MIKLMTPVRHGPIGLELGSRSLHMIQFRAGESKVLDAVRWDLPATAELSTEARIRQYAGAVAEARSARRFRGRDVAVCLGAGDLFVQNIRVAKGPTSDLPKVIAQEAAGRLPFPVSEAELRYLCAGDVRQGDQTKREVILLACHQKVIEQVLEIVDQAGLRAVAVEIEPSALLRAYSRQSRRDDKDQRAMFVRAGQANTTVVIAQGSDVFFVKYIDVGGQHLDEAVAQHMKIPLSEASTLRRHNGERRADQQNADVTRSLAEATRGIIERLVSELSLCIRYHSVTFRGQPLARVVIGGGEAVTPLVELLSARLNVKCELGDPLRSFESTLPSTRRAAWDVAAGLALKGID